MTEFASLSSAAAAEPRPSRVGVVHLGLGAFHRAHQAWYTALADDAQRWGIAAFTGRSPLAAEILQKQDGLYTLIERGETDRLRVMGQILHAYAGTNLEAWAANLSDPAVTVMTSTVTESGYGLDDTGSPDWSNQSLLDDVHRLRSTDGHGVAARPSTIMGRMVAGLAERRRAVDAPLSIVPCDNVPENGIWLKRGVLAVAERVDTDLAEWMRTQVRFIRTAVDRITPAPTVADSREVESVLGLTDRAPVVTERYTSWILSGEFVGGRPAWESAGAQFVEDVAPFEQRKLWLLNGAHTALALLAPAFGATTVSEAIANPECLLAVEEFWDAAERHLPENLAISEYRESLLARFADPGIKHLLAQIAIDSSRKLQVRVVPVALAERAEGRDAKPMARIIAAWISRASEGEIEDSEIDPIRVSASRSDPVRALIRLLDARLADDSQFVADVRRAVSRT